MPEAESAVTIIGGGLAGSEAALQLARRGISVTLREMRPTATSPAHSGEDLAELVCSNSFKSDSLDSAAGCLKRELADMGSILLRVARETAVAAGGALAVDRAAFSRAVTQLVVGHPRITVERSEADELPEGRVIIATGPLTSSDFEPVISGLVGERRLAFYDAAAPVVDAASLDREVVFEASRYDKGEGADYLNVPMSREEYDRFYDALVAADRVIDKVFDRRELFAACQPVEEVARTGRDALRFGALKPVGITDPRTGERPWAVVQLRAENRARTAFNLVGFQTNLTWPEQRRVFTLIPGLEHAEFHRFGVMHRNTFIDAPSVLDATLAVRELPRVRFAGQVAGTEGYTEAIGSGLLAALNTFCAIRGLPAVVLPSETVLGALIAYATNPETAAYQPMHVNFGIVPPLAERVRGKRARYAAYGVRSREHIAAYVDSRADLFEEGTGE